MWLSRPPAGGLWGLRCQFTGKVACATSLPVIQDARYLVGTALAARRKTASP